MGKRLVHIFNRITVAEYTLAYTRLLEGFLCLLLPETLYRQKKKTVSGITLLLPSQSKIYSEMYSVFHV